MSHPGTKSLGVETNREHLKLDDGPLTVDFLRREVQELRHVSLADLADPEPLGVAVRSVQDQIEDLLPGLAEALADDHGRVAEVNILVGESLALLGVVTLGLDVVAEAVLFIAVLEAVQAYVVDEGVLVDGQTHDRDAAPSVDGDVVLVAGDVNVVLVHEDLEVEELLDVSESQEPRVDAEDEAILNGHGVVLLLLTGVLQERGDRLDSHLVGRSGDGHVHLGGLAGVLAQDLPQVVEEAGLEELLALDRVLDDGAVPGRDGVPGQVGVDLLGLVGLEVHDTPHLLFAVHVHREGVGELVLEATLALYVRVGLTCLVQADCHALPAGRLDQALQVLLRAVVEDVHSRQPEGDPGLLLGEFLVLVLRADGATQSRAELGLGAGELGIIVYHLADLPNLLQLLRAEALGGTVRDLATNEELCDLICHLCCAFPEEMMIFETRLMYFRLT